MYFNKNVMIIRVIKIAKKARTIKKCRLLLFRHGQKDWMKKARTYYNNQ